MSTLAQIAIARMEMKPKCEKCEAPAKALKWYDGRRLCGKCREATLDAICEAITGKVTANA